MDSFIWDGSASDNARNIYIDLAKKYKQKNGSLSGFLSEYGALKIGDNLHKVRLSGDRFKLANIYSYNKYQQLRSSREGYNQIRADLQKLGFDNSEIDQFIKQDQIKYKSTVSKIGPGDSKGHIKALDAGGRDGSWNIEPEPKSQNFGKHAQSPSDSALMAEGTPRSTKDAFIRYKDSSGLPNPSDYTPEQRNLLRQATSSRQVDTLLSSFDKQPNTPYLKNISKQAMHNIAKASPLIAKYACSLYGLAPELIEIADRYTNGAVSNGINNGINTATNYVVDNGRKTVNGVNGIVEQLVDYYADKLPGATNGFNFTD